MYNEVGARELVTPPALEPFSAAEVKAQLRISISTEDALIDRMVLTARTEMENYLRRALINQTWKVKFDRFPSDWCRYFEIPYPKLQTLTHVKYYDPDGGLTTWPTTEYESFNNTSPARIALLPDKTWPITQIQRMQAVEVQYVAGYGANKTDIPKPIMEAMLLRIGDFYENRENLVLGTIMEEIPQGTKALVSEYRCMRFFG